VLAGALALAAQAEAVRQAEQLAARHNEERHHRFERKHHERSWLFVRQHARLRQASTNPSGNTPGIGREPTALLRRVMVQSMRGLSLTQTGHLQRPQASTEIPTSLCFMAEQQVRGLQRGHDVGPFERVAFQIDGRHQAFISTRTFPI
jgi:hypothetical protein